MQAYVIVSLIVALLAVVFALQNNIPTAVHFLAWKFEGSLALVILVATAAGALISFFASLPALLKIKWHLRHHKKRLAEMEAAARPNDPSRRTPTGTGPH